MGKHRQLMKKNLSDTTKRRKRDMEENYTPNPMCTNRRVSGVRDSALPRSTMAITPRIPVFNQILTERAKSLTNPANGYNLTNTSTMYKTYCNGADCSKRFDKPQQLHGAAGSKDERAAQPLQTLMIG